VSVVLCVLSVVSALVATYFGLCSLQAWQQTRRIADALTRGARESEAMRVAIAAAMAKKSVINN
jgi:hypothetical protein